MNFGISFSPLVPVAFVWTAAAIAAAIAVLLLLVRSRGAAVRIGALALMVLALANPSLTREDRDPLTSVAVVVVDKSPSQHFGDRNRQTEQARAAVVERLSRIPGLDLTFNNPPAHYDFKRDIVTFEGEALGKPVNCAISREALDDHFGNDGVEQDGRIQKFLDNRSTIEQMARTKFLSWPIEDVDIVLIKTTDVARLLREAPSAQARKKR